MEDKLQIALADLINKSVEAAENGAEFLAGEIPDVVYQLLMWHAMESAVYCLLGIVILVSTYYWIRYQIKYWGTIPEGDTKIRFDGDYAPIAFGNVMLVIPVFIAFILINITWLQILIAPKVWLIEYGFKLLGK